MQIKIPDFEVFVDSNISGRFIINPFWIEHLLNLFYQGYVGEVSEEVSDTIFNHIHTIENTAYGIIGVNFAKKHLSKEQLNIRATEEIPSIPPNPKGIGYP